MILKGSQRGGAIQLARHLMNELDNDHISLHQMRGFVSGDLAGALEEIQAISKGTRCSQYLFSLSLSPPELESAPPEIFEAAITKIEQKLGLAAQPRAIVFHEKNGRRHAHCVWSRIDASKMRGINLPHFKMKLQDVARDLFIEHQWKLPAGFKNKGSRDPLNYGSVESEQGKRVKRDPKQIKAIFQRCWALSDSKASFAHALAGQGYILAKGDRRGFVAVDRSGEIYSVSRWVGVKTKEVRARLGVTDGLPHVEEALLQFEVQTDEAIDQAINTQEDKQRGDLLAFTARRLELVSRQRGERLSLDQKQAHQLTNLTRVEPTYPTPANGLKSIWNCVTGNADKQQAQETLNRTALHEKHALGMQQLIESQLQERRQLQQSCLQLQHHNELSVRSLWRDLGLLNPELADSKNENIATRCVSDPMQPLVLVEEQDNSIAQRVRKNPPTILEVVSRNKEQFSRNDIARALSRYIDDPTKLYLAIDQTFKSAELVETDGTVKNRYTTKELIGLKKQLQADSLSLLDNHHGKVTDRFITAAIKSQNKKLQLEVGASLSDEQEQAIKHVLKAQQLSLVTGYAGAGKSTMLEAAAIAWQRSGYNVIGAALSGKAADGLEKSSGIQSRTIASLEKSWKGGYNLLCKNDVLVIDEAGMVDLRQMARVIAEVKSRGAKLVLVGDAEQLQPIQAGTPFKEIEQLVSSAMLTEVHRQKQGWQCEASKLFADKQTDAALQCYQEQDCVTNAASGDTAISSLVEDYMQNVERCGVSASRLAMAHRRKDVHLINQSIRKAYQEAGLLGEKIKTTTDHGPREFAIGDRIVLTKNDRELNVRNGMLGSVVDIEDGNLVIALDGEESKSRTVTLNPKRYASIEHGYATTIHKSQGATVDKSFVLASNTMDRHLTYVAMTRHREDVQLYVPGYTRKRFLQPRISRKNQNLENNAPARS